MAERTKIASQSIDGSVNTITFYGDPDDSGKQAVINKHTFDVKELSPEMQLSLAAVGFGRAAEGRWNRKDSGAAHAVAIKLWNEMKEGNWAPGRVFGEAEPTDLQLALAEVTKHPIHLVQKEFEERMKYVDTNGQYVQGQPDPAKGHKLYRDAKGRTHRYYDKAQQDALQAHPAVAAVIARIARERAQAAAKSKGGPDLGSLFGSGPSEPAAAA